MRMKTAIFNRTVATVGLMSLLWLLYTLTIPSPSQAAIFFDTDFETCATGTGNDFPCEGWDDFGQESVGFLRATTTNAFSGSKSVQMTFNNINGSTQQPSIYRILTPQQSHIFARVATRFKHQAFNMAPMASQSDSDSEAMLDTLFSGYPSILEPTPLV